MSKVRAGEVWKEIKPFAIRDLNAGGDRTGSDESLYAILLYKATKDIIEYSVTASGLGAALAAADSGDVVFMPPATISGDYSVSNGVSLVGIDRKRCILTGQIILGSNASLGDVSVTRSGSASAIYGVVLYGSSIRIYDCLINVTNSGGDAVGVYGQAGASVYSDDCIITATGDDDGYGYYANGATIYVQDGSANGSTAPVGSE